MPTGPTRSIASVRTRAPTTTVNIPVDAAGYDATRDDPDRNHIVTMIGKYEAVLADRTKFKEERAEALQFLTHLIGDPHSTPTASRVCAAQLPVRQS